MKGGQGASLAVQWLGLHLPTQGVQVQTLVSKLRSHMLKYSLFIYFS